MNKEEMAKKEFDVRTIVEDALTSLRMQGLTNQGAVSLLAIQSIIRTHDTAELRRLIKFIEDHLVDDDGDDHRDLGRSS